MPPPAERWRPAAPEPAALAAGRFDRRLDARWRRTSYSGITEAAHDERVFSEPEEDLLADEGPPVGPPGDADGPPDLEEGRLRAIASPMADLPAGVELGSLVHAVLERADFAAPDLEDDLARLLVVEGARAGLELADPAGTGRALAAALATPLGPLLDDRSLRDIGRADRLDELAFELPLAGGDAPAGELDLAALARLLVERVPDGDPLAGYAERLADPALQGDLRGYLVGSIDLVARVRAPDGSPRFAVVDYKTNRLGPAGEPLSAWHYRPASLAEAMQRAHYPLQALLYAAALHRYLRWRLPDADPEHAVAGVLYLFVRGMTGPDTPRVDGQPCGVFAWRPPEGLVGALSDLLDRGAAA